MTTPDASSILAGSTFFLSGVAMKHRKRRARRNARACTCGYKYTKRGNGKRRRDPRTMRFRIQLREEMASLTG